MCGFLSVSWASPLDKTSKTFWMRFIVAISICVDAFIQPSCRLNLTTSCWGWPQELFHLTSQAGYSGLLANSGSIKVSILSTRGNLGRRMAEESTPIQDSDRSVRGLFFSHFCVIIVVRGLLQISHVVFRFALNDAGRSMVTTLVARILEDPQLRDTQMINLSWTTTIGEV